MQSTAVQRSARTDEEVEAAERACLWQNERRQAVAHCSAGSELAFGDRKLARILLGRIISSNGQTNAARRRTTSPQFTDCKKSGTTFLVTIRRTRPQARSALSAQNDNRCCPLRREGPFDFRAQAEGPILLARRVGTVTGFIPAAPILVFPSGVNAVDGIATTVSLWRGSGHPRCHLRVFNVC